MSWNKEQTKKSLQGLKGDEELQFCWGIRKGAINLYESFTFDGIEYFLYDCVYMWHKDQAEPNIAKLVRICEMENHEKKVEVVWFFRPSEIADWLGNIKPLQREIFLTCGQGQGQCLSSLIPLEAISGKCIVVCSSQHKRNPQPTEEELRTADYIFYRTFDVRKHIISEIFPSSIGGIEVDHFFNRSKKISSSVSSEPTAHLKARSVKTPVRETKNNQSAGVGKGFNVPGTSTGGQANTPLKDVPFSGVEVKGSEDVLSMIPNDMVPLKKRKLLISSGPTDASLPNPPSRISGQEKLFITRENKDQSTQQSCKEKVNKCTEKGPVNKQHLKPGISYKYTQVTRRPHRDSSELLNLKFWMKERLSEANEKGTLVVLENLDPSFASEEVEDIIWHIFEQNVEAKMVQRTAFSSPHSGQALAIFKTKEAADEVITQLTKNCLVLGDGRPIVGRRRPLKFDLSDRFHGHVTIDRTRFDRQCKERKRNAVPTSYFSISYTLEFDLATQWLARYKETDNSWRAMHKKHGKEIEALMNEMKIRRQE